MYSSQLTRKTLTVDGGSISYLCSEPNVHPLNIHLFHATGFNAQTYRQILEPLSEHFNVYASDLRGHGKSDAQADPTQFHSWDIYRQDFYHLLDSINQPIYLIGHSVGSIISIAGACERPDIVKGLILTEPLMYPPAAQLLMSQSHAESNPMVIGARKRRALFPSKQEMVENYIGKGAFKTWPRSWIEDYVDGGSRKLASGEVRLSCEPEWEAKSFQVAEITPWDQIAKLQCPTTILYGASGFSTCSPLGVEKYVELHPETRVIQDSEASHFLPMENPQLVIDEVVKMAFEPSQGTLVSA
ncbi:MAG TPA: alpha/beta hydrolase [Gammaproteobacteria bacterium]|nr:alpha/beta hydrolase [Gammaproteobacteria bacterium]